MKPRIASSLPPSTGGLVVRHHKWVSPMQAEQLTDVERGQVLHTGQWRGMRRGTYSLQDVLRGDDTAYWRDVNLWRISTADGHAIFDMVEEMRDSATVFHVGTTRPTGLVMIQGGFTVEPALDGLEGDADSWIKQLTTAWRVIDHSDWLAARTRARPVVNAFVEQQRTAALRGSPLTVDQLSALLQYLSDQPYCRDIEHARRRTERFLAELGLPADNVLRWFAGYQATSDQAIKVLVSSWLRPADP